jgi:hypothetical protein
MYDFLQYKPISLSKNQGATRKPSLYHYNGFTLYNKNYSGFDRNDLLYASGRAGLKYTSSNNWYVKLKAGMNYIELDRSSLVDYYRLDVQAGQYYGSTDVALKLSSNYKHYHHQKNGKNQGYHLGQTVIVRHMFNRDMSLSLSAANIDVNLKDNSYSYDSKEFEASFKALLWGKATVQLSSLYSKNSYRDVQRLYTDNRIDSTHKHRLSVNVEDLYQGLGAEVSYTLYKRDSNHDINVYDRSIVLLTLKYSFGT